MVALSKRRELAASWGPDSSIKGREKYPAVHIAYADAVAYVSWAGKRLPHPAVTVSLIGWMVMDGGDCAKAEETKAQALSSKGRRHFLKVRIRLDKKSKSVEAAFILFRVLVGAIRSARQEGAEAHAINISSACFIWDCRSYG
jgi:hypothetical protein